MYVYIFVSFYNVLALTLEDEIPLRRQEMAALLADLGFSSEMCIKALELTGDNADRAGTYFLETSTYFHSGNFVRTT